MYRPLALPGAKLREFRELRFIRLATKLCSGQGSRLPGRAGKQARLGAAARGHAGAADLHGPHRSCSAARLSGPETQIRTAGRLVKAGAPDAARTFLTKPEMALPEIDWRLAAGLSFGVVRADAGNGPSVSFGKVLSERGLMGSR